MTPSGTELAFGSVESLTGYDNTDQKTGEADAEVYLYDATAEGGAGKLVCASCNPTGARPIGSSVIDGSKFRPRNSEPGGAPSSNNFSLQRNLSDDGGRLFFDSNDALVPADTNGRQDVYEYEAPGTGTCTSAASDYVAAAAGCIDLISSARSEGGSYFYDASTSGDDVFFLTRAQLVGQDTDSLQDLYDARVGGGLASQNPPPPPAPCSGESCRGAETAKSAEAAAGTPSFSGPGNQVARHKRDCSAVANRAKKLSRQAKKLSRQAKKARGHRAIVLNRRSSKFAKKGHKVSKQAKACTRANRGGK